MEFLESIIKNATPVTIELKITYKGLTSLYGKILDYNQEKYSLLFYSADFHVVEHFCLKDIDHIAVGNQIITFIFVK